MFMRNRIMACAMTTILLCGVVANRALSGGLAISLAVDATESSRKILHVHETIPARAGPLTLLYPKWIPGEHGPTGPVIDVAGLRLSSGESSLPWRRDLEDMYAVHCTVPSGSSQIDVSFDFILPPPAERFSSGASSSSLLLVLSWNQVIMYPNDAKPDDILVAPSLTIPAGWTYATPLKTHEAAGKVIHFVPVSLTTLIDSPVQTGLHIRRIDLTPPSGVPHFLDIMSENEAAYQISEEQISQYRKLVLETNALFGSHHYDHYDFLYTLSDEVAHFGLEHHQSSDDRQSERALIDPDLRRMGSGLLAHEFVHSWNGKYRRPSGLATGDFSTPMKDDLLWIYEGLTQYLGKVLSVRSGLRSPQEYQEDLALLSARLDNRPGRTWRPLQDVNDEASLLYNARKDWDAWRREVDFYDEGDLIWLEADITIRELSGGKKSLDDFCKKFHGGSDSGPLVKPYTIDDVVKTLNEVAAYDWKTFLQTRLQSLNPHAPMGGVERGGWKLVYRDTMSTMQYSMETSYKIADVRYSLGFLLLEDGTLEDVIPDSPAAKAGIGPGMSLVAVNGRKYSKDFLRDVLKLNKPSLELLCRNGEYYKSFVVDYHGGERYPHLERDASRPDILGSIIRSTVAK